MGATNQTPILGLPQFVSTDKPQWLGDVNGAFSLIDAFAGKTNGDITAASNKAEAAQTAAQTASSSVTTLEGVVDGQAGSIQGIENSISNIQTALNTQQAQISTIQSKLGFSFVKMSGLSGSVWSSTDTADALIPFVNLAPDASLLIQKRLLIMIPYFSQYWSNQLNSPPAYKDLSNGPRLYCQIKFQGNPFGLTIHPYTPQSNYGSLMFSSPVTLLNTMNGQNVYDVGNIYFLCLQNGNDIWTYGFHTQQFYYQYGNLTFLNCMLILYGSGAATQIYLTNNFTP